MLAYDWRQKHVQNIRIYKRYFNQVFHKRLYKKVLNNKNSNKTIKDIF
jgi:hypothetical protein